MTKNKTGEIPNFDEIRLDPISHIHRENNPRFIASIARGLEILRCFSATNQLLGNQEIAQLTNLPKPTVAAYYQHPGFFRLFKTTTEYHEISVGCWRIGFGLCSFE